MEKEIEQNKKTVNGTENNTQSTEFITEEEISLIDIFKVIWRQKWFIVLFTLAITIIGSFFIYTLKKPVYNYSLKLSTQPLTWNQYDTVKNNLSREGLDRENIEKFYSSLDQKFKKTFSLTDLFGLKFSYDPLFTKTFIDNKTKKNVFDKNKNSYYLLSFSSRKNDKEKAEKILTSFLNKNLNLEYLINKFIIEDFLLNGIYNNSIESIDFSSMLLEKYNIKIKIDNLIKIANENKEYNKNMDKIIIYNNNNNNTDLNTDLIPINQQIIFYKIQYFNVKESIKSYFLKKMKYNFYNNLFKNLSNYDVQNIDDYYNYLKTKILSYNIGDENLSLINKYLSDSKSEINKMFELEKLGLKEKIDSIYKLALLNKTVVTGFNYSKSSFSLWKYIIILFVISGFLALIFAFIVDFFQNNKEKLFS